MTIDPNASIDEILAAAEANDPNEVVYKDYTRGQLDAAFNLISDPEDWRAPLHGTVKSEDLGACLAAAEFFTGSGLQSVWSDYEKGLHEVKGAGYRNGPCGP